MLAGAPADLAVALHRLPGAYQSRPDAREKPTGATICLEGTPSRPPVAIASTANAPVRPPLAPAGLAIATERRPVGPHELTDGLAR